MFWISVFGIFSIRGTWWKRILKIIVGAASLPVVIWLLHQRNKKADQLLKHYPQIHSLAALEPSWTA